MADEKRTSAKAESSDEDKSKAVAKAEAPKAEPPAPAADPSYPVTQMIAGAPDWLGYPSYVAAGGLYGAEGELSVKAAQQKIEAWLVAPVSTQEA